MVPFVFALLASLGNCRSPASEYMMKYTEALVIRSAPLIIPVTENPMGYGVEECVRFDFNINERGHAINIRAVSDSGNFIMNLYGRRALEGYKFQYEGRASVVYTIAFHGRVGGLPSAEDAPKGGKGDEIEEDVED